MLINLCITLHKREKSSNRTRHVTHIMNGLQKQDSVAHIMDTLQKQDRLRKSWTLCKNETSYANHEHSAKTRHITHITDTSPKIDMLRKCKPALQKSSHTVTEIMLQKFADIYVKKYALMKNYALLKYTKPADLHSVRRENLQARES